MKEFTMQELCKSDIANRLDIWNSTIATNWLQNDSASGTLYMPSRIYSSVPSGVSGCPVGWTKERI